MMKIHNRKFEPPLRCQQRINYLVDSLNSTLLFSLNDNIKKNIFKTSFDTSIKGFFLVSAKKSGIRIHEDATGGIYTIGRTNNGQTKRQTKLHI